MASQKIHLTEKQLSEVVNLYRLGIEDDEVALHLGYRVKAWQRWLHSRQQIELRQAIKQARVQAKAAVRQALFQNAIGTPYRPGRPRVIQDGNVVDDGEAASAAKPGFLQAQQYWLENCDDTKKWRKQPQFQANVQFDVASKSEQELIDFIVGAIADGVVPATLLEAGGNGKKDTSKAVNARYRVDDEPERQS